MRAVEQVTVRVRDCVAVVVACTKVGDAGTWTLLGGGVGAEKSDGVAEE